MGVLKFGKIILNTTINFKILNNFIDISGYDLKSAVMVSRIENKEEF